MTVSPGEMSTLPGVLSYEHDTVYEAEIVAINGDRDMVAHVTSTYSIPPRGGVDE